MKHKHYENWILSERPLPEKEGQSLQEHICECDSCYALSLNWRKAEAILLTSDLKDPAQGFSSRWHARLAEDCARSHQRQSFWMLSASGLGAAFFLFLFFWLWGQVLQSGLEGNLWLGELARWGRSAAQIAPNLENLHFHLPKSLPLLLMMAFFALVGAAGIAWLKVFRLYMKYQGMTTGI